MLSLRSTLLLSLLLVPSLAAAKSKKDRGEASMKLGEATWKASRASAYLRDDSLKILASYTISQEGKTTRQALTLTIKDYKGPGTYELNDMNSNFTAVGINTKSIEGSAEDAAQKMVMDAFKGSTVILMRGTTVTITSIDAKEAKGTFSWPGGMGKPPITDGVFRAIVKDKRGK